MRTGLGLIFPVSRQISRENREYRPSAAIGAVPKPADKLAFARKFPAARAGNVFERAGKGGETRRPTRQMIAPGKVLKDARVSSGKAEIMCRIDTYSAVADIK
jgi:hypothetical protein